MRRAGPAVRAAHSMRLIALRRWRRRAMLPYYPSAMCFRPRRPRHPSALRIVAVDSFCASWPVVKPHPCIHRMAANRMSISRNVVDSYGTAATSARPGIRWRRRLCLSVAAALLPPCRTAKARRKRQKSNGKTRNAVATRIKIFSFCLNADGSRMLAALLSSLCSVRNPQRMCFGSMNLAEIESAPIVNFAQRFVIVPLPHSPHLWLPLSYYSYDLIRVLQVAFGLGYS